MTNYEIIIVGAGPSGCSAALMLGMLDKNLANQTLLVDKAVFPRPKLCAGGITLDARALLRQLGVRIEVPSIPIHISKFLLPNGVLTFQQTGQFEIVGRKEFDHDLFQSASERGIQTQDAEAVQMLTPTSDGVIVSTSKNEYRAKIVIGADGANSSVRKLLPGSTARLLMMGLEIFVPEGLISGYGELKNTAIFDFSKAGPARPGYFWIFPTLDLASHRMSLGLMQAPFENQEFSSLSRVFADWLSDYGIDLRLFDVQGHPAIRYDRKASSSGHRVLLVGDALGIDPLFGEGITSALATGVIAAQSAVEAIRKKEFSFSDYKRRIQRSYFGTLMRRRCIVARKLYRHPGHRKFRPYDALLNWVAPTDAEEGTSIDWTPDSEAAISPQIQHAL